MRRDRAKERRRSFSTRRGTDVIQACKNFFVFHLRKKTLVQWAFSHLTRCTDDTADDDQQSVSAELVMRSSKEEMSVCVCEKERIREKENQHLYSHRFLSCLAVVRRFSKKLQRLFVVERDKLFDVIN